MQSLLHRARQAHRCGCRACSTLVQGAGRRATVARRKPTFAELFTAAYSSVFATAAVIDAVRKDERRRDLDRQIDEAQRELDDLRDNAPDAERGLPREQQGAIWEQMKRVYEERPFKQDINNPAVLEASELLDFLRHEHYGCPKANRLRTGLGLDYAAIETATVAEENDASLPRLEPQTPHQLKRELDAVEKLIKSLVRQLVALNPNAQSSPTWMQLREQLDAGRLQFAYPSIDRERATQNVSALNQHLRRIMSDPELDGAEKILRVCYNLVISPYAPNTHTYNTLILGFDQIGLHKASNTVVQSFFYDRLIKPTPCTSVAVLNHYKCSSDGMRFMRMIARITGMDPIQGAKSCRRAVEDVERLRSLRAWAGEADSRTATGRYVYQHAPLNHHVVEELIRGLLHFQLFKSAATILMRALVVGIHVSTSVLHQVLDECVYALDWQGATEIVRGFSKWQQQIGKRLAAESEESMRYVASRLQVLNDLLGIGSGRLGNRGKQLELLEIPEESYLGLEAMLNSASGSSSDSSAESNSRFLRLESLQKELNKIQQATRTIERRLVHPKFDPAFRHSMLVHISEASISHSLQLQGEFASLARISSAPPATKMAETASDRETNSALNPIVNLDQGNRRLPARRNDASVPEPWRTSKPEPFRAWCDAKTGHYIASASM